MSTKNTTTAVLNLAVNLAFEIAGLRQNLTESARKLAGSATAIADRAEVGASTSGRFGFSPQLPADVLRYQAELLTLESTLRHLLVTIGHADEIAAVIADPFSFYEDEEN